MTQFSLYPVGSSPVATSEDAAEKVKQSIGARRQIVLRCIAARDDLTADECAAMLDQTHNSVAPRFTELVAMGYVEKTATRRKTRSGGSAFAHRVTSLGRDVLKAAA